MVYHNLKLMLSTAFAAASSIEEEEVETSECGELIRLAMFSFVSVT